mmetsp:Transcript_34287/g.80148  ORF Transcript_34287/g.80148 Transcript_34287/m.80148 type:complete len:216 (+) Transcript_34287:873-1520(+)
MCSSMRLRSLSSVHLARSMSKSCICCMSWCRAFSFFLMAQKETRLVGRYASATSTLQAPPKVMYVVKIVEFPSLASTNAPQYGTMKASHMTKIMDTLFSKMLRRIQGASHNGMNSTCEAPEMAQKVATSKLHHSLSKYVGLCRMSMCRELATNSGKACIPASRSRVLVWWMHSLSSQAVRAQWRGVKRCAVKKTEKNAARGMAPKNSISLATLPP